MIWKIKMKIVQQQTLEAKDAQNNLKAQSQELGANLEKLKKKNLIVKEITILNQILSIITLKNKKIQQIIESKILRRVYKTYKVSMLNLRMREWLLNNN